MIHRSERFGILDTPVFEIDRLVHETVVHQSVVLIDVCSGILVEVSLGSLAFFGEKVGVGSDITFILISDDSFLEEARSEPSSCDVCCSDDKSDDVQNQPSNIGISVNQNVPDEIAKGEKK
jgi:hypothetical protein